MARWRCAAPSISLRIFVILFGFDAIFGSDRTANMPCAAACLTLGGVSP
jgi:hypothetical protein